MTTSTPTFDLDAYTREIERISNHDLVQRVADAVLRAATMAGSRFDDGVDDAKCGALYREAVRRGNPGLYDRGHNDACESQGHSSMCTEVTMPITVGDPTRS